MPVALGRKDGLSEKTLDVLKQQKGEDQHRCLEVLFPHFLDLVWRQVDVVLVFGVVNDENDTDGKNHDGKEYIQKDEHCFHFLRTFCLALQRYTN